MRNESIYNILHYWPGLSIIPFSFGINYLFVDLYVPRETFMRICTFESGLCSQIMVEAWHKKSISQIPVDDIISTKNLLETDDVVINMIHCSEYYKKYTVMANLHTKKGYYTLPIVCPTQEIKIIGDVKFIEDSILKFIVSFSFNGNSVCLNISMDNKEAFLSHFLFTHKN